MQLFGYLAALFIGLSLGVTGSGGSILTVPVLVYLIGLNPVLATSYSLFIVGSTSLVGGVRFQQQGLVCWKTVISFGLPSLVTVYLTRLLLIPALPDQLFTVAHFTVTKEMFLMVLFAGLMIWAAIKMLRGNIVSEEHVLHVQRPNVIAVLAQAIAVGFISGLVGAGGGFLIIPALVIFLGLNMKQAVGTSLTLIALNSLVGFLGDLSHYQIDWQFLLIFTVLAILGILVGTSLSHRIDSKQLKKVFAIFILVMGVCILLKEILWALPIGDQSH